MATGPGDYRRRRPDTSLIVLDGHSPADTLRAMADLDEARPELGVLIVGPLDPTVDVMVALASGAFGYLPTSSAPAAVGDAVIAMLAEKGAAARRLVSAGPAPSIGWTRNPREKVQWPRSGVDEPRVGGPRSAATGAQHRRDRSAPRCVAGHGPDTRIRPQHSSALRPRRPGSAIRQRHGWGRSRRCRTAR